MVGNHIKFNSDPGALNSSSLQQQVDSLMRDQELYFTDLMQKVN